MRVRGVNAPIGNAFGLTPMRDDLREHSLAATLKIQGKRRAHQGREHCSSAIFRPDSPGFFSEY
jgi:hypothetical protein